MDRYNLPLTLAVLVLVISIGRFTCQELTSTGGTGVDEVTGTTESVAPRGRHRNKPLYRVATVEHAPWVMMGPRGQYQGYIVDLLDRVSSLSGFEYVMQPSSDQTYGAPDFDGKWGGIVGDLRNNIAEIGAADLIITEARKRAVTFSAHILRSGAQILIRNPDPTPSPILLPLLPFTWETWVLLVAAFLLVVIVFCLIDTFSPCCPNAKAKENTEGRRKCCSFWESCVFALRSILFQGSLDIPRPASGRILLVVWWVFSLVLVLCYLANLVVCLVSLSSARGKPVVPFQTFDEMSRQSNVAYGGWFGMILNPSDPLQRTIDRYITSHYTHYNDMQEAVARVRNEERPFAAIVNGVDGEYASHQNCDLLLLRDRLFDLSYALACSPDPQGQALCTNISQSVLHLRENGELYFLKKRWWDETSKCPDVTGEDHFNAASLTYVPFQGLELAHLCLPFALVLIGLLASGVVLLLEVACHRRRPAEQVQDNGAVDQVEERARSDPPGSDRTDLGRLSNPEDPLSDMVEKYVEEQG